MEVYYMERDDKTKRVDQDCIREEFENKLDRAINKIDTYKCAKCKKIKSWLDFDNENCENYEDGEENYCFCEDCLEKLESKNLKINKK